MEARKGKSSKKLFIFIAAAVVLIGGIVFIISKLSNEKTIAKDQEKKIPVLLYHHMLDSKQKQAYPDIKNSTTSAMIVTTEQFEEQMKYLSEHNYHTLTLKEFEDFMKGKKSIPEKSVLITFDDGLKTNYTHAYPILKKYKMHAAAFLITSKLANTEETLDPTKLQRISKKEMEEMKDVFEFGSHTHDMHGIVNGEEKIVKASAAEVKKDFETSKNILHTKYFAYAFGKSDSSHAKILEELKYQFAFTVEPQYVTKESNPLEMGRFAIYPYTNQKQFIEIVSGKYEKKK